jgi:hypothetical protein
MSSRFIRGPLVLQNCTVFTGVGNYSIINESNLVIDKASGAATQVTLPSVLFAGQAVFIKDGKGDAGSNNITVIPDGVAATTIDGGASALVNINYGAALFLFNGVEWGVIARSNPAVPSSQAQGANGLFSTSLKLLDFRNADGSALAAAAAAGKFGAAITLGTSFALVGEVSNNNTKTDDALIEYTLPPNYVAGSNVTVTVNVSISTAGAPTYATKTVQVKAYLVAPAGTMGADIGPGAASAITVAGADVPFVVTGTTLVPGNKLLFELEGILHDTGAVACNIQVSSFRVS